jgi:hypothetical protein
VSSLRPTIHGLAHVSEGGFSRLVAWSAASIPTVRLASAPTTIKTLPIAESSVMAGSYLHHVPLRWVAHSAQIGNRIAARLRGQLAVAACHGHVEATCVPNAGGWTDQ